MPEPVRMLHLERVSRRRGNRTVVDDLELTLERGTVLGLLGVNGAGKSTTLAMIAGALTPGRGRVLIDGHDPAEDPRCVRELVGWLPERSPLYPELTVAEQLDAHAALRGLRGNAARAAIQRVRTRLDLGDLHTRLSGQLSQGQRQRLALACALLHDPPLLVLDEPANGLDPVQSAALRELIRELGGEHAVILSTHVLAEVTACCDRVAILHEGRLRHDAPLDAEGGDLEQRFMGIATGVSGDMAA